MIVGLGGSQRQLSLEARRPSSLGSSAPAEIGVRPEHIDLLDPSDGGAHLTGKVLLVERLGNLTVVYVETDAGQVVVEGKGDMSVRTDDAVGLRLDTTRTHAFGAGGNVI